MIEINLFDWLAESENWEKPKYLLITLFVVTIAYFSIGGWIINDHSVMTRLPSIAILFFLLTFISAYWIFSTNRLVLNFSSKTVVLILLNADDSKETLFLKRIISNLKKTISESKISDFVIIKNFPINYLITKKKINKYLNKYGRHIDIILLVTAESGKYDGSDQIHINELGFYSNNGITPTKKLIYDQIDLVNDLKIRTINKKWIAIEENIGNDKKKISEQLKDVFLFYFGLHHIMLGNYEMAIDAFNIIYKHKDSFIKSDKIKNNTIIFSEDNIMAGRLRTILIETFLETGITFAKSAKYQRAREMLLKCEPLLIPDHRAFAVYLTLARCAYECNDISKAKEYTEKMDNIQKDDINVILNKAFFAILEDNIESVAYEYNRLYKKRNEWDDSHVDVLEFLQRAKVKHAELSTLFNFAIGMINKVYVDVTQGDKILRDVIETIKGRKEYTNLYNLAKKILKI